MCGRIFQTYTPQTLSKLAQAKKVKNTHNYNPTYNMGPTNYIPAIRAIENDEQWQDIDQDQRQDIQETQFEEAKENPGRGLDFLKWGYQTSFSLIINARAEEMQDKPTFRPLLNTKRCVVMAQGYYEWNKKKEPFLFQRKDQQQLMVAALYTDHDEVFILTRDAFGDYEKVHTRMPVLLEEDEIDLWINIKNNFGDIIDKKILNQQKKIWGQIYSYQLAPYVNSIKEKSDKCLQTLEEYKTQQHQKGLGRFFTTKKDQNSKDEQKSQNKKVQEDGISKQKQINCNDGYKDDLISTQGSKQKQKSNLKDL